MGSTRVEQPNFGVDRRQAEAFVKKCQKPLVALRTRSATGVVPFAVPDPEAGSSARRAVTVHDDQATLGGMTPEDIGLRNQTYRLFVELGRAPSAEEVAAARGTTEPEVLDGWRRLHDEHALVLAADGSQLRMANPFSAVPTNYRVHADGRWWYANCAWDAFGICAALHCDGRIETSCPDCGEALSVEVRDHVPDDPSLLFHCLLPAAQWWDDIVFT